MIRRVSNPNYVNCQGFLDNPNFQIVYGDLGDEFSIGKLVHEIQPDFFINLAANSFVACSWDMPQQVMDTNAIGVLRCLEAIKSYQPNCRFYSAGSSEEFGNIDYAPQDMKHPMKPRSPYGVSKCAAHHLVKVYRESYDMYAVHGVLFNHEGTKRGEEFVTRKITKGVARIHGKIKSVDSWRGRHGDAAIFDPIELGNLDSKRDWSDSEDFVEGIWLMLNQDNPKDYLLASGEAHSIREFVEKAFDAAGFHGHWEGKGVDEKYLDSGGRHKYLFVKVNPDFYRPAEVELLLGDPKEAIEELGWKPKNSFDSLVLKMVQWDIEIQQSKRSTEKSSSSWVG
jgi:GDPmannose 4,6-dehydratase